MTSENYFKIAKIVYVDNNHDRIYYEGKNNLIGYSSGLDISMYHVNQIIFIDGNNIESAPEELWQSENWVGNVKLKLQDKALINNGYQVKIVKNSGIEYEVGNTVEVNDNYGIISVLSKEPIKLVDIQEIDDSIITKFKTDKEDLQDTFDDFGGYETIVQRAKELIDLSLNKREQLIKIGARPIKGILFTGSPGTGKTMLARIIAKDTETDFYEIKGPEIISKWYGQSEQIIRLLFSDAKKQKQAIIFFDEIDSIGGHRDENSHEASRRIVAQLLTEMDGFSNKNNVVVIATSNRPQDIDPALLRPGRFDWEINFPDPLIEDRLKILIASARKLKTQNNLPLGKIAKLSEGWSAAELSAIWAESALIAVNNNKECIYLEDFLCGFERVNDRKLGKSIWSK